MNRLRGALIVAPLVALLVACGDPDNVTVNGGGHLSGQHTDHTGVEENIWPPQPRNMANELALPATALDGARESVVDAAFSLVINNPNVRNAIGDYYRVFDRTYGDAKSDITASFLFYSYNDSKTVDVSLKRDGTIEQLEYSALDFQPPAHAEEIELAISLARAQLTAEGYQLDDLTGTAMLAIPRRATGTGDTPRFYAQRTLYVTFGLGDGELPFYRALVNVESNSVSEVGVIN